MEVTSNAIQTVASGANVLFTETPIEGNSSMHHREGSGFVSLKGVCGQQRRARFLIFFSGNIAVANPGANGPIQLSIAVNGEAIQTSRMIITASTDEYFNVSSGLYLEVPKCCCYNVSVKNTTDVPINVQNANLIIERVA